MNIYKYELADNLGENMLVYKPSTKREDGCPNTNHNISVKC